MKNLIKLALKSNDKSFAVEMAIVEEMDFVNEVYLDNVYSVLKESMTPSQFAGYLSGLAKEGKYKSSGDQHFGKYTGSMRKSKK